jgi:hypothetical protein
MKDFCATVKPLKPYNLLIERATYVIETFNNITADDGIASEERE